jgi:hypothetical protein
MTEHEPKPGTEYQQSKVQQYAGTPQKPDVAPFLVVEQLRNPALRIHRVKHKKNLLADG